MLPQAKESQGLPATTWERGLEQPLPHPGKEPSLVTPSSQASSLQTWEGQVLLFKPRGPWSFVKSPLLN